MSDLISRKAVLNTLENMDKVLDENRTVEAYKDLLRECFKELPPVQPQEKVGKWVSTIVKEKGWNGKERQFYQPISCSVCRKPNHIKSNYCPNCGAKMKGESV